jgi:PhzF family phenazine biosynthesis protein
MTLETPQSIPNHLLERNKSLWSVSEKIEWDTLDKETDYIISGSAFIDVDDVYGRKGNPFTVVIGPRIANFTDQEMTVIARIAGTPETIFIHRCEPQDNSETLTYNVELTVKTPTGKGLGACAHGFTGAIQTLLETDMISIPSTLLITTTLQKSARAFISEERIISLEFKLSESQQILIDGGKINEIFGIELVTGHVEQPVLSVGSPKLTIEITEAQFDHVQQNLGSLNYEALLLLQNDLKINGIHLFCRNSETGLPAKVIQANAYLGRENVVDPATGVSCAAQIGSDEKVNEGETVKLTQYTANGPSADLHVTKKADGLVDVGGTAVLFNFEEVGHDTK